MNIDVSGEIIFSTARSGGKGGQNVNKVETMVEGRWFYLSSNLIDDEKKELITSKLYNKITADDAVLIKSQQSRTQLGNKELVIFKMNELINAALKPKKARLATKIPKAIVEKRINNKKINSEKKVNRQKIKGF